jgi:hypothetical protein
MLLDSNGNFLQCWIIYFKQAVDLNFLVATSGFLMVPSEWDSAVHWDHWDTVFVKVAWDEKDSAASAVLNCVFKNVNYCSCIL